MKIEVIEKKLVMGLYFFTLLASLLTVVDNFPFMGLLLKVRYIYIIAVAFFCVYDGVLIWNRRFMLCLGLLVLHTFLYGVVFVNPRLGASTSTHFQQLIMMYLLVFFTCMYIYKKGCYFEFIQASYWALACLILWSSVTHLQDFVNPIYFINIFSRTERFRAAFGMGDVNYCGNYCVYTLVLQVFLYHEYHQRDNRVGIVLKTIMGIVAFFAACMLFSTASRSAILSLLLFFGMLFIQAKWKIIRKHWKLILGAGGTIVILGMLVLIATGAFSEIWIQSNREGNFSINFPIFIQFGNYLNGMGYMDNSGFLNQVYGYATTAMDVYFLYIPFSTGILGAVLIFGQMIYLFYLLLRYWKVEGRIIILSLFVMMLFYAIWQVNYMNYRYFTGIIHSVILLYFTLKVQEESDTKWLVLKRR